MNTTPIQNSFAAGELSPLMYGRSDLEGYQKGLKEMLNMLPDSRGPGLSRKGSRYVRTFDATNARVISLPVNNDRFYTAVFANQKIFISSVLGIGPNEGISGNPDFVQGLTDWEVEATGVGSVAELVGKAVRLYVPDINNRQAILRQPVTVVENTDYRVKWNLNGSSTGRIRVGTTPDGFDILNAPTSSTDGNALISVGAGIDTLYMSAVVDENIFSGEQEIIVDYFGISSASDSPIYEADTPYADVDVEDIQYVQAPDGSTVYILHESYPPYKVNYDRAGDTFEFEIVTFISEPPEWNAGSYPSTGTYFEGRLWLGGVPLTAQTFWGSRSGIAEDFTLGANDDDAIVFTMARYGKIEWIVGFKNLMIGTVNGEYIVNSVGGVITPSDIKIEQQSSYGSAGVQPVQVGDQIMYVSPDGRKLRAIQYQWEANNWLSQDLTFNSEHITRSGIKRIVWHQNPANLLHCVLRNGDIATLTYDRSVNSYGWCRLQSQGRMLDAAVAPIAGTDYLHGLVSYSAGKINLETQAEIPDYALFDSWVERFVGGTVITQLEHLEGFEVQILGDGAVYPPQVVTNGQVTLQNFVEVARVGLGYVRRLRLLPYDKGAQSGSAAPYEKRWNKIYVRLQSSANPKINGIRPPSRAPSTPMNLREPNRTQDIGVVGLTYDRNAEIVIEEDLPVDLNVVSIFGEMVSSIV